MSRRTGDLIVAIDGAINATTDAYIQGVLMECAEAILLYRLVINARYPEGHDKSEDDVDATLVASIDDRRAVGLMR